MKAGDEIVLHEKVTIDDWLLDDRKKNLYTFNNNFSARKSVSADRGFFLCGYSFGYYMIDYLRYKNKKKEIEDFFKNYNGSECRSTFRKDARNEFD